jgi:hypothetical protein
MFHVEQFGNQPNPENVPRGTILRTGPMLGMFHVEQFGNQPNPGMFHVEHF